LGVRPGESRRGDTRKEGKGGQRGAYEERRGPKMKKDGVFYSGRGGGEKKPVGGGRPQKQAMAQNQSTRGLLTTASLLLKDGGETSRAGRRPGPRYNAGKKQREES